MELLWHNGQVVLQNQRLSNIAKKPSSSSSVKLHGGGDAAPPPPLQPLDENLIIQEDEMTSWLQYPLREDDFCSDLLFSASASAHSAPTSIQVTAARPPTPSARPPIPPERPAVRNFMNFSRLRGNFTGRFESGQSISKAIVRESTQVSPTATPSAAATESGLPERTDDIDSSGVTTVNCGSSSAVAYNLAAPGNSRKGKAVATASEIPGASSSAMSKSETEPVIVQPKTGITIVDDRKRKEREAAIDETECRSEVSRNHHRVVVINSKFTTTLYRVYAILRTYRFLEFSAF